MLTGRGRLSKISETLTVLVGGEEHVEGKHGTYLKVASEDVSVLSILQLLDSFPIIWYGI